MSVIKQMTDNQLDQPTTTDTQVTSAELPPASSWTWPLIWTTAQVLFASSGLVVYFKEVDKWQQLYNPNNYASGWSGMSVAPFKWWAYNVIWSVAWTSIALANLGLKFMGLD